MSNTTFTTNPNYEGLLFLDCRKWSHEMERLLYHSLPHSTQSGPWPIHCILPLPNCSESIVLYDDNQFYHSNYQTLTTLFRDDLVVPFEYRMICQALDSLSGFQKRRHPFIVCDYVLFPLGAAQHSIWLNPASIVDIWEENSLSYIVMASGPGLIVPVSVDIIQKYASNALLAFACSERDLPGTRSFSGRKPLDFLELPDTPFIRSLISRGDLQTFPILEGEYRHYYFLKKAINDVLETVEESGLDVFDTETLADLLNNNK